MNMAKSRDILRLFLYFPDGGKYNVENSNCEGTEQLRKQDISPAEAPPVFPVSYFSFVPGYRMFFTFSLPASEYPDKF